MFYFGPAPQSSYPALLLLLHPCFCLAPKEAGASASCLAVGEEGHCFASLRTVEG